MKNFICFVIILLSSFSLSFATSELEQFTIINIYSSVANNNYLLLKGDNSDISVEAYTPTIVRIALYTDFIDKYDNSPSLVLSQQPCKVNISNLSDSIIYRTDSLTLIIHKHPFSIDYYDANNNLLTKGQDFFKVYDYRGIHSGIDSSEAFYAIGSHNTDLNRHGKSFFIFQQNQYAYKPGELTLNFNIPFIISSKLYAYYIDNYSLAYLSIGANDSSKIQYNSEYGQFNFFFIKRSSYPEIVNDYSKLTGLQPLPPKWAFGYHQSKFAYYDRTEVMTKMPEMRKQGFPIDIVIFDYTWYGFPERMGNYTWYTTNWGNSKTMLDSLRDIGIQAILITEPFISAKSDNFQEAKNLNLFLNDSAGVPLNFDLLYTNMSLIDIFKPESQSWLWSKHQKVAEQGIAGWWCDLGEPDEAPYCCDFSTGHMLRLHNIYNLIWSKSFYENSLKDFPHKRPYFMSRSGWAGSQRYGVFPQCGDNSRSFGMLKYQIPQMLSMGLSGIPYFASDIGGFASLNLDTIPQLYTRWMQFGAFSPIMRVHMVNNGPQAEPIFWDDSTKNACRKIIKLRYKLFPYNYTEAYNNTCTGIPIAKPMNFYDNDNRFRDTSFQYYWGNNFIVAPIYDSARFTQNIALPNGNWINFWNNKKYKGNQTITIDAPYDEIPLMVKSSSIIPMADDIVCINNYKYDSLEVNYYPDLQFPNSYYSLYEDDGTTPYADTLGLYRKTNYTAKITSDKINFNINISGNSYPSAPGKQFYTLNIIKPTFIPDSITIDDAPVKIVKTKEEFEHSDLCTFINYQDSIIYIKFILKSSSLNINAFELTQSAVKGTEQLNNITCIPNPFSNSVEIKVPAQLLSNNDHVEIYDINGNLINCISPSDYDGIFAIFKWNGQNQNGNIVESGAYFIKNHSIDNKIIQKIVFIK